MTKHPTKPIELNHCKICNQMTNWLDGVCQKCEPIAIDEIHRNLQQNNNSNGGK